MASRVGNLFVFIARIKVNQDKVQKYLALASKTDQSFEDIESGKWNLFFD
tara:strand:- start:24 stop:173 length:150 start_codon:yes stop_codon:yes gene_type:complete